MKKRLCHSFFLAIGFVFLTQSVFSQGLLINESSTAMQLPRASVWPGHRPPRMRPLPPHPVEMQSYSIKELAIDARIRDQIAEVNVSQTFVNTGGTQMEVSFVFPLPYNGAIDQMVLLVDGKEYPAKLQDAAAARKTYEDIVRRNRDPALLEWIGTGMFKTSVFPVPAGASRTVSLRYSQLLRNESGVSEFLFPLSTAKYTSKPIEKMTVSLNIETAEEIKNVFSPTHGIEIKRPDPKKAIISLEVKDSIPSSDFRLFFDSGTGDVSTKIIGFRPDNKEDGFFLMLASPKIVADSDKPIAKTVLFVLDRSGSMSGAKIEQARNALKFVLNNLSERDTFNIITYNDRVESFKPEIQSFTPENRKAATDFCDAIRAGGSTNIGDALSVSLKMLQDKKQPGYVLFLTDGLPTVGEQNEMKLAELAKKANEVDARLFSFGVGFDVNARLLDRLARDNNGQSEFVLPNEDIEDRVSRLFGRISAPVLTGATFEIKKKGPDYSSRYLTNRVYPNGVFDLFAGQQLVIVGRYSQPGDIEIKVQGKVGESVREYAFSGLFPEKSADQTFAFIERLWAMRRIGEILDSVDLKGKNQELIDELVGLSTKHGILTPYTSFLADEGTVLSDTRSNAAVAGSNLGMLRETSGSSGVQQRGIKQEFQQAENLDAFSPRYRTGLSASSSPPSSPSSSSRKSGLLTGSSSSAMGSGMMGGMGGRAGIGMPTEADEDKSRNSQQQVQTINNRAFFQKDNIWIDATLTAEQQKPASVITVKQFSDEYFKLIEKHGKELSQYLVFDETVLVNFNGQAYRFEP